MSDLEKLRREIDAIDEKIIDLIAERTGVVYDVAKYKARNNIFIVDNKREADVIKKNRARGKANHLEEDFIEDIYKIIIAYCRDIQKLRK